MRKFKNYDGFAPPKVEPALQMLNSFDFKYNSSILLNMQNFIFDFTHYFIGVKTNWADYSKAMSFTIADYMQNNAVNIWWYADIFVSL